jgi:hypothetical protein
MEDPSRTSNFYLPDSSFALCPILSGNSASETLHQKIREWLHARNMSNSASLKKPEPLSDENPGVPLFVPEVLHLRAQ